MEVIYSKKEFIKFCKENNIKCTKNKDGIVEDSLVLELSNDLVIIGEYANSMGVKYEVEEVDKKVIIKGTEYPYGTAINYDTVYTFDNSNNQVLAVFGLWGGWNVLIRDKANNKDNIKRILLWEFYGE